MDLILTFDGFGQIVRIFGGQNFQSEIPEVPAGCLHWIFWTADLLLQGIRIYSGSFVLRFIFLSAH